ncbi:MAG TPA: lytic transglycosylase domain-containing protein [Thermoanaerobaculia bacterium]|nr:lytic transglycosylase domain-containing protein [Thermoanaerobaculia bacterium]
MSEREVAAGRERSAPTRRGGRLPRLRAGAVAATGAALLLGLLVGGLAVRDPAPRRPVFRADATTPATASPLTAARTAPPPQALPPRDWTTRFLELEEAGAWDRLVAELAAIERDEPDLYAANRLGYLHARALLEQGDTEAARPRFQPFLESQSELRAVALFHAAQAAAVAGEQDEASRLRGQLLGDHPGSPYHPQVAEDELAYRGARGRPGELLAWAEQARAVMPDSLQRDLDAYRVAALFDLGRVAEGLRLGLELLAARGGDDAADRVSRALDRADLLARLDPESLLLVAETLRSHRHFDRAVELLSAARRRLPAKRRAEVDFAIGRAHFFAEDYQDAWDSYLRAAQERGPDAERARYFFHAARAAQLLEDDRAAEELMTRAIAVRGRHAATSAALTSRLRLRAREGRWGDAAHDLRLLQRLFPRDPARVEGAVAYAVAQVAAGEAAAALVTLAEIPQRLLGEHEAAEVTYWRARALESVNPEAAVSAYLLVLRSPVPTHFAYLVRERLRAPQLAGWARTLGEARRREAAAALAASDLAAARRLQTDAVLLPTREHAQDLARLAAIYRQLPQYREVLELTPHPLPRFPLEEPTRGDLLLAMGLFDDAVDVLAERYPLTPMRSGLTRSQAFHLANASRESIHAIEVLMQAVPDPFAPELLPRVVRELLYPRYFYPIIAADAARYGVDPRLVLAVMREESRFNARAKSVAAARGLMQFIITTARQVGRDLGLVEVAAEDLYDPRIIIHLGASYLGSLLERFDGDLYAAAAAYNAGPHQSRAWRRLAPAPGPDYFLSAISFSETKHYVRKVLNSYYRYGEIYMGDEPAGGTQPEP